MIGIVLIICVVLLVVSYRLNSKEGFTEHSEFLDAQTKKYNPVGISLIASNTQGALGTDTSLITGTAVKNTIVGEYELTDGPVGLFDTINKCEAATSADCSAFNDPTFGKDCGLCLDIGTADEPALNSKQSPSIGGRVVLASEREYVESRAANGILPRYEATVGTCPANRLVVTKAQCLTLERELKCKKNASYDLPSCSQCYSDTTYTIVDPNVTPGLIKGSGTINLMGEGVLKITESGFPSQTIQLSSNPRAIQLKGIAMTQITMAVTPQDNQENPVTLSGYLSGTTTSGKFNIDLYRIVLTDSLTGRKPSTEGATTINGVRGMIMTSGFGQTQMSLVANSPFTFVEPLSQESARCKTTPFVTTQAAAEFLESDPCYKRGSGPGNYLLECLQNSFLANGCTQAGAGFPSDTSKAAMIMTNSDGSFRTIDTISNYVYSQALLAATGISGGQQATIESWSAASVFCNGKSITSPCDTVKKTSGPLTKECLSYLWNNQGASKPLGATYSMWSMATSLFSNKKSQDPQFCRTTGTMSPLLPNGQQNTPAINYWQQQGGVDNVKSKMNDIHQSANYQGTMDDAKRSQYISQCYGPISIAPQLLAATSTGCQYPSSSDAKGLCGNPPFMPRRNTNVGKVNIPTGDYTMSFTITPKGLVSDWGSLIHVTNGDNCCNFGQRSPAIWFTPGNTQLHIRIGDTTDGNWGLGNSYALPMNVATPVSIITAGKSVIITVGKTVYTLVQPTKRPTGNNFIVYMADPWYPAMNVLISDFTYVVDGVKFIPKIN